MWPTVCHPPALAKVGSYLAFVFVLFVNAIHQHDTYCILTVSLTIEETSLSPHYTMYLSTIVVITLCNHHPLFSSFTHLIITCCHYTQSLSSTVLIISIPLDPSFSSSIHITYKCYDQQSSSHFLIIHAYHPHTLSSALTIHCHHHYHPFIVFHPHHVSVIILNSLYHLFSHHNHLFCHHLLLSSSSCVLLYFSLRYVYSCFTVLIIYCVCLSTITQTMYYVTVVILFA